VLFTAEGFGPAKQLSVDLGEFFKLLLQLAIALDSLFSGLLLGGRFEEELIDFSHRQALGQIVEGAVLFSSVMAVTIGFATGGESLDQGGAQAVGQDLDLREQEAFAFAQRQGGLGGVMNPSHVYGKDSQNAAGVNKKENA